MNIRAATDNDIEKLKSYDKHISEAELTTVVKLSRIFIIEQDGEFAGWLRYNLFWDSIPFMNMLFILSDYRGKGYGTSMVHMWEDKMKCLGYTQVMTSTASDEFAQHFYVNLGYTAVGSFIPLNEPMELIFRKEI